MTDTISNPDEEGKAAAVANDVSVTTLSEDVALAIVVGAVAAASKNVVPGFAEDTKEATENTPNSPENYETNATKRRLCRFPGCNRVIKSQGHCQRHGARAKRCRMEGCDKQAQGTHDGMCKRHWKELHFPSEGKTEPQQPPPPTGESVYDNILPLSIAFRPNISVYASTLQAPSKATNNTSNQGTATVEADSDGSDGKKDLWDAPAPPVGVMVMPLVHFLRESSHMKAGWHRNQERLARGVFPVSSLSVQLEPWERQLVSERLELY